MKMSEVLRASQPHRRRMERRACSLRKRQARYHVTACRRERLQNGKEVDNRFTVSESNDLNSLFAIADDKAPAYIVDWHARPTPEVVYVALPREKENEAQHYMQPCE